MSPGPDTMIQSAMDRRNLPALFAALPLLKQLDADSIGELANEIEWFSMPGGATLYSAGQAADGLYVIINGAFGIYVAQPGGGSAYIGQLCGGQIAGQMEVISGNARSSTLVALRDSEVARLSCATFDELVRKHPQTLRYIASTLADRVDTLQHAQRQAAVVPKTFAVVPLDSGVAAQEFGAELVACLRLFGRSELILSSNASERTTHWFHRLERGNDFVVYVTDPEPNNWTRLCLRQADRLLLVAAGTSQPRAWRALTCGDNRSAARTTLRSVQCARVAPAAAVPTLAPRARQGGHRPRRAPPDRPWCRAGSLGRRCPGFCAHRRHACTA
jgi:NTE family protein